jgi:hypothetical protein
MGPLLLLAAVPGFHPAEVRLCRTVRHGPSAAAEGWPPTSACCEAERNSSAAQWCCSTPAAARAEPALLCLGMEPGDDGAAMGEGEAWMSRDLGAGGIMKLLAQHTPSQQVPLRDPTPLYTILSPSSTAIPSKEKPVSMAVSPSYYRARLEQTLSDGPACTDAGCSASRHVTEELTATVAMASPSTASTPVVTNSMQPATVAMASPTGTTTPPATNTAKPPAAEELTAPTPLDTDSVDPTPPPADGAVVATTTDDIFVGASSGTADGAFSAKIDGSFSKTAVDVFAVKADGPSPATADDASLSTTKSQPKPTTEAPPPPVRAPRKLTASSFARR